MAGNNIAPTPRFPERAPNTYERKFAPSVTGNQGPLRFEEGLGTDTDVPNDFQKGALQGYQTPPGRPNHNLNVFEKYPDETMKQRAHVGSAAWVEEQTVLSDFATEAFQDYGQYKYEEVIRDGTRQARRNPAVVND